MTPAQIEAALVDADPETRRRAVIALEESGSERTGELALLALGDEDWRVRKEAVRVASELAVRLSLLPDLVAAIAQGDNVGLRNAALEVLGNLGTQVSKPLLRALDRSPAHGRKFVVEALGDTGDREVAGDLARLCEDSDPNVAAAAIDALARIGGPEAENALRARLASKDPFHRTAALDGLDRLEAVVPWDEIAPLLGDRLVRRVALRVLGRTGRAEAVPPLVDALEEASAHVVADAAVALSRLAAGSDDALQQVRTRAPSLSERARETLRRLVVEGDLQSRQASALLLLLARDTQGFEGIAQLAAEGVLTQEAGRALSDWGAAAVPGLLDTHRSSIGGARAAALELAADLAAEPMVRGGSPEVVLARDVRAALRDALDDPDLAVVRCAVRGLTWWAESSDAPRLVELAARGDEEVARAAGTVLESLSTRDREVVRDSIRPVAREGGSSAALTSVIAQLGDEDTVERLQAALTADDPRTRRAAVEGLERVGGARAAEHVALALADENVDVQTSAARALGRIRDAEGRPTGAEHLLLALGSESPAVRAAAARALGEAGEGRAVEPLRELVRTGAPGVAVAAMEALRALSDPTLGDLLVEALGHADEEVVKQALLAIHEAAGPRAGGRIALGLSHAAWDVRRLAAELLGEVGGADARAALEARYEIEGDDLVRTAIEVALAAVGGRG